MKLYNIKKQSFRNGDIDSEKLYRFKEENERDEYFDSLVELESEIGCEIEKEENGVSVYPDNEKWAYYFEKCREEIEFMELPKKK